MLRASTLRRAPRYSNAFRLKVGQEGICGWVAAAGAAARGRGREPRAALRLAPGQRNDHRSWRCRSGAGTASSACWTCRARAGTPSARRTSSRSRPSRTSFPPPSRTRGCTRRPRRRAERLALVNRISAAAGAGAGPGRSPGDRLPRGDADLRGGRVLHRPARRGRPSTLDFRIQVDEGVREPPVREPLGAGLTSRVAVTRNPLLVNDVAVGDAKAFAPQAWGTGKIPTSWIGVPMLIGETDDRGHERADLPGAAATTRRTFSWPPRSRTRSPWPWRTRASTRRSPGAGRAPAHGEGPARVGGEVPQPRRAVPQHHLHLRRGSGRVRQPRSARSHWGTRARSSTRRASTCTT